LDDCLVKALAKNSPSVFINHQFRMPQLAKIDCGNGWYHVLNQIAFELISLSRQSGFQVRILGACNRFGALHIRWISLNELLASEREAVAELVLYHAAMSRFQCEVCGRYLPRNNPLIPRCEFHCDEQSQDIDAGALSSD
jgi:hypothetical protein